MASCLFRLLTPVDQQRPSRSLRFAPTWVIPTDVILTKSASPKILAKMSQRRDFTINGMMLDPLLLDTTNDAVLDFVGGRDDLQSRNHPRHRRSRRRFGEDKLRMLRAVRFAARFEYQIEPATMAAIQKLAPQIHQVSCERIREELTKMLTEGRARRAFQLLDETKLLSEVLPEIARMKGVEQPPQYHPEGDVFVHTLLLLDKLPAGASKRWLGERSCTTSASLPHSASRPIASASTATSTSE